MVDSPVAHGYTLNDLHTMTLTVLRLARSQALDGQTAYDTAWSGIAERLCEPGDLPTWRQLIRAGQQAVDEEIRHMHRTFGVYGRDHSQGVASSPGFLRYWRRPVSSLEDAVIERTALWQVLTLLTPAERDALVALAMLDDYQAAADALRIPYDRLCRHVNEARRRFRRFWYAPETSPPAVTDRRVRRRDDPRTHCVHGHELTEENVYQIPRLRGTWRGRLCRTCRQENEQKR